MIHKPYSQKTSLAVVAIVGCVALWVLVIAFTHMNEEINQLQKDVIDLKLITAQPLK